MSLRKLIPALCLMLCLCLASALAYDAPDVKIPAKMQIDGIDAEAFAAALPGGPTLADGVISLPDGGYTRVELNSLLFGDQVELTLREGLWSADYALDPEDAMYVTITAEDGENHLITWRTDMPTPLSVTFVFDGDARDDGVIQAVFSGTPDLKNRSFAVYFEGGVSASYSDGALVGYRYPYGDEEWQTVYFFVMPDGSAFAAVDDAELDPDDFPPLEIVAQ